jgi:hypothetical protein
MGKFRELRAIFSKSVLCEAFADYIKEFYASAMFWNIIAEKVSLSQ